MEGSLTYLPNDMLVKIFLRLGVESLMQIRGVCKSWYQIIGSSCFIKSTISSNTTNKGVYTLHTHGNYSYSLVGREASSDNRKYYYTAEQFGINVRKHNSGVRIYGSCNGLLCVSDVKLRFDSVLYLLNPFIRRAKNIGNIPVEVYGGVDLCLGYFDGDFKVIKIVRAACSDYGVGVYSLSTNSWKITSCDTTDVKYDQSYDYPSSRCVNGVAYFVKYRAGIVCFDLHDESIRQVNFPEKFNPVWWPMKHSFTMEETTESIALMEISHDGHLVRWQLRKCGVTNSLTWEKQFTLGFQTTAYNIDPIGFTYDGKYIVRNDARPAIRDVRSSDIFYTCDLGKSQLKKCKVPQDLQAINNLAENLVLLNEQTLVPFVESEATGSAKTMFVLCKRLPPKKKAKKDILHKRPNELQGRRTKRKLQDLKTVNFMF